MLSEVAVPHPPSAGIQPAKATMWRHERSSYLVHRIGSENSGLSAALCRYCFVLSEIDAAP